MELERERITPRETHRQESKSRAQGAPVTGAPILFQYQDHRKFLKDWLGWKKSVLPEYSGAMFAKRAGLQSHTLLGMVIRGDRNLGYNAIRSFAKALDLKAKEKIFFEKLVLFNQAKTSEDRSDFFAQLVSLSEGGERSVLTHIQDYARYISHWYVVAIKEMVALADFQADPEWISKRLKRKITKKQAEEAWELLLSLEMVRKNGEKFEVVHPSIDIDPKTIDFAIRGFHKEFLDRAKDAIDHESLQERELSSLTLTLTDRELASVKEKINEFRKHLNQMNVSNPKDPERKHVVAVNMQLMVLTGDESKKGEIEK